MRKGAAFNFVPELIGDFAHAMELSGNPKLLYIEAAVNTLHTAVDVFTTVEEHENTERKNKTKLSLQQKYDDLKCLKILNFQAEELRCLDNEYENAKSRIQEGNFRDKEVRAFIMHLKENLKRVYDIFQHTQIDPDYPERIKVEEIARKTLRDYNKLVDTNFEEEEKDGQNGYS